MLCTWRDVLPAGPCHGSDFRFATGLALLGGPILLRWVCVSVIESRFSQASRLPSYSVSGSILLRNPTREVAEDALKMQRESCTTINPRPMFPMQAAT